MIERSCENSSCGHHKLVIECSREYFFCFVFLVGENTFENCLNFQNEDEANCELYSYKDQLYLSRMMKK